MVWRETPSPPGARLDAEQERELRLISQARAGADWALAALVARYQPMVVRYLTRLVGDPDRARELAEKVFLRMERRLRGPHGGEYLRLWLLRASTEDGLEALRHPRRGQSPRLDAPGASRLLAERVGASTQRLREGLGKLAERTSTTSRQVRQLIWATEEDDEAPPPRPARGRADQPQRDFAPPEPERESLDPRAALRHRLVRAVLAEIAYGDAQCLALHLVAGLNQAEVAQALGIRASAARKHIVLGLEMFAQRYEAALAELGIPAELAYADPRAPAAEAPALAASAPTPEPVTIESTAVPVAEPEPFVPEYDDGPMAARDEAAAQPLAQPIAEETEPAPVEDSPRGASGGTGFSPDEGDSAPPFLVEPPLWQRPELAEGALAPAANLGSADVEEAGPVAARSQDSALEREDSLVGTAAASGAAPPSESAEMPPIGPVRETPAVAAAPEFSPEESPAMAERALAYETATLPSAPPAVVPVLSGRRPAARRAPAPAEPSADQLLVVPILTASEANAPAPAAPPRVVPVRTPGG